MAAIIPHLEEQNDPSETPEEEAWFNSRYAVLEGLGAVEYSPESFGAEGLASKALQVAHSNLIATAWTRRVMEEALVGRTITVTSKSRDVIIQLDQPIGLEPRFNPPGQGKNANFKLLGWTSKMGAPSFSLPAGPPGYGGSCPGATAGQSIVPERSLVKASRTVEQVLGEPVVLPDAVCEWCLAGDTRVVVAGRGLVRLDELTPGERLRVWDGQAWRETELVEQGVRDVVELETTWGMRLRLTPDHKVLSEGVMVPVSELEEGAKLDFNPPRDPSFPTSLEAPNLPEVAIPEHPNALQYALPTRWDADVGVFMGLLVGDGCVSGGGRYKSLAFNTAAEDASDLERLADIFRQWCTTSSVVRIVTPKPDAYTDTPKAQARLSMKALGLVRFAESLGVDKTSDPSERRLPQMLWSAPLESVRGFLQGLFAADGSVSAGVSKVEVSLAQVSRGLLEDVQQLLFALGIRSNICEYTSNADRGFRPLYKLSIGSYEHVQRFQRTVGFASNRKTTALKQALESVDPKQSRTTQPRVRSVRRLLKPEPVFDLLNVGPNHRFSANCLTVSNCYAEGGNYRYGSKQLAQVVLYAWAQNALQDGSFVDVMDWAVKNANYELDGNAKGLPPERHEGRFFRIHDSGDFFSRRYLEGWKEVARRNPDILFWAPTRIWAVPQGVAWVNEINSPPDNLIIRPSAYMVDRPSGPYLGPGWAGWSVVYDSDNKPEGGPFFETGPYNWDCQAYAVDDEKHNCRLAMSPDGETGCRACWIRPELAVNYTKH